MKRICTLLMLALLAAPGLKAQDEPKTYTIIANDPYDLKAFKLNVVPLTATFSLTNITAGGGLQAMVMPTSKLRIEAYGYYGYYHYNNRRATLGRDADRKQLSAYEFNLPYRFGGEVEYGISDKLVDRTMEVATENDAYGSKPPRINIKSRIVIGPRVGFDYYWTTVAASNKQPFVASDGRIYGDDYGFFRSRYYTGMSAQYVSVGASYRRIDRVTVHDGGDFYRHKDRDRQYFLDILVGSASLEDLRLPDATYSLENTPTSSLGWRLGYESIHNRNYVRAELGQRPSIAKLGFYAQLSFGITLLGAEERMKLNR